MITFGNCNWNLATFLTILGAVFYTINTAKAQQVIPDNTLPNNSVVNLENNITNITGGTQRGGNLFHSFERFGVPTGGEVNFNNTLDINNIINRVTGGNISNIDGLIRANGAANLFLINPNGIVFGENARLDIGGSFIGSTADALRFGEDNFFSASNPESSSELLSINPNALFFNQLNPTASIQSNSFREDAGTNAAGTEAFGLRVPDGKSLLLVGGDINIDGGGSRGGLYIFGGRVELGGLASEGTVGLNSDGNNFSLSFPEGVERSNVSIRNQARVNVRAGDGGSIAVNARNLEMTGESFLLAGIDTGLGDDGSRAGNIDINVSNAIDLKNSSIRNEVRSQARGQGGDVNIGANTLLVENGALVSASTLGAGKGGNLTVNATDIQMIGGEAIFTGFFTQATSSSTGDAGNLLINTNTLKVENGAEVSATTFGGGKGGSLTVNAQELVQLIGSGSGLFARAEDNSTGNAGNLLINTNTLLVENGAEVNANIFGGGKGGNLTVNAQELVQLIGSGSGLFARAESTGDAGNLLINTNTLLVENGADVSATTFSQGKGGNLTVNAQELVQLIGSGSGLFARAESTGDAGNLLINTNTLKVENGAEVNANILGAGKGGNLTVEAQDIQLIGGEAGVAALTTLTAFGSGDAGDLKINTNTLLVKNGALASTSTLGGGKGGNLTVEAQDVQVIGGETGATGLTTLAAFGSANAGDLKITTNTLLVENGADVSASTLGEGKGGNLTVEAQDVQLIGGEAGVAALTTLAAFGSGDAGDLKINTNTLLVENGADVSASTLGAGKGGNLTVEAQDIQLIGDGSGLFARADENSTGDAGNLLINTNTLKVENGADVSASTLGAGKGGNLTVEAQDIQLIGSGSGLFARADENSTGDAGNLLINTNTLKVENGADVSASTFGAGKGGNLTVNAQELVQLIGDGSGLFARADENSTGDAGNLLINTNTLKVENGADVSASTFGAGKAGNLTVNTQDIQMIGGEAGIASLSATASSTGNAGDLKITTNTLKLENGALVSTGTLGGGKGGNLTVEAQDIQLIGNEAGVAALSTLASSTGNAGDLKITTNTLLVENGALVDASTLGEGKGGNLTVDAQDIQLIGGEAGIAVLSALALSTGNAGELKINTDILKVENDATVSVESFGTGRAGNLTIDADSIRLNNDGLLSANTLSNKVDPERQQATINIKSGDLILRRSSNITTNAVGENIPGGNINIDSDVILALENSDITANSANFRGGNINIEARGIFGTQFREQNTDFSDITATGANSELSGRVEINGLEQNPVEALTELPTAPVEGEFYDACQVGEGENASEFYIVGTGGIPPRACFQTRCILEKVVRSSGCIHESWGFK